MTTDARRLRLVVAALVLALLLAATIPISAMSSGKAEAERLHSSLASMAKLVNHRMRPPSQQLAQDLPADADRLDHLREPASAAQEQLTVALGEMRQMNALTLDPHYTPALVAVGRAFVSVSGEDPLTRTTINPEYLGLERELAGDTTRLRQSGDDAGKLLREVKRLSRQLVLAKRRAHGLELKVRSMRARRTAAR
jgi:hypothetical protein